MRNLHTFHDGNCGGWLFKCTIVGLLTASCATSVFALDPNRKLSQYSQSSWGSEKGLTGNVSAIAQTADGYLWIGTENGLLRFDGLNFQKFEQAGTATFPIGPVQKLLEDDKGGLWVLLRNTKLLHYHDGVFEPTHGEAENGVTAIGRSSGDGILLSSLLFGTLSYKADRVFTVSSTLLSPAAGSANGNGPDDRSTRLSWSTGLTPHRLVSPNTAATSIIETRDGKIWLGTDDSGLFYLSGEKTYAVEGTQGLRISCLLPLDKSQLWIGTAKGIVRWSGTQLTRTGIPRSLLNTAVLAMFRDSDSNLWIGTPRGLLRVNADGVSSRVASKSASNAAVDAIFEDRERNIWIGGPGGLERLRDRAFVTYELPRQFPQGVGPVYIDSADRVWFAPMRGLRNLTGDTSIPLEIAGLSNDTIYSIAGHGNDLWIGRQHGGLTHLHYVNGSFTVKSYTHKNGLAQDSVYAVYQSRDGTVWAGTLSGGVSRFQDGRVTSYTTAEGLASNTVSSIAEDADGTMWFGTPSGVTSMSKSGWHTYAARDVASSPDVNCLLRDSNGALWIGTAAGLALLKGDNIHVPQILPESLRDPIFGIAEDKSGWLWVATASHVVRVKSSSLLTASLPDTDFHEYGIEDGLHGTEGVKRFRSVVTDSKGQVWISTNRGLSVANPARATLNAVPALVHIEALLADGVPIDLRSRLRIPPAKQRITFRYAALSLSNPEHVQYRYKLDDFDNGWSQPVTNPEATYGNLTAGSYRFRVMASNGEGMWSGSEATIGFELEPVLWQTWWFRLSCLLSVGLAALLAYRLRMRRLTELLSVRFEERLAERTRIAQELHDTLLQGLLSISMHLHVALDQSPENSPARATLNRAVQLMEPVIQEGRNTIRGLRSSIHSPDDLITSFSQIPLEMGEKGINFCVIVEGATLPLRPDIRDDVYRIGREALVNAFRHSGARNINLHLEYAAEQLRVLVEDDGCGIESQVLHSGRDGHWGLSVMRERAKRIGGNLKLMSRAAAGTEVELRVPSKIAFESTRSSLAWKWFAKFQHQPKGKELMPR